MAYKQSPLTMIQGTAGHKSALKAVSPLKQDYVKDRYHAKFNPTGTKGKLTSGQIQDKAVEKLATDKNISRKAFDTKLAKITKTVDPHQQVKSIGSSGAEGGLSGTAYEKSKVASKTSKLQKFLKPAKEVIKKVIPSGVRTGLSTAGKFASKAFLPLAIAETMYSFGKTSVERKKAGQSGFNISKSKTNKGFNFNK